MIDVRLTIFCLGWGTDILIPSGEPSYSNHTTSLTVPRPLFRLALCLDSLFLVVVRQKIALCVNHAIAVSLEGALT